VIVLANGAICWNDLGHNDEHGHILTNGPNYYLKTPWTLWSKTVQQATWGNI